MILSSANQHSSTQEILSLRIRSQTATIAIIGLGYVGLPLANAFINKGFSVIGFDIDDNKINALNAGQSYINHISNTTVKEWHKKKKFNATSDPTRLELADVIIICVPTPLTESREPDLTYVIETTETITSTLRSGQLIILESTTYPTTTTKCLKPILDKKGLKCGEEYFLAYSPEREDPGNPKFSASNIPKVVGGADKKSLKLATELYQQAIIEVVQVSSTEVAEACKILENTYRAVNIALVNEMKVLFDKMGIDIWEVINAAKSKPFGFQPFYPGPGLGGHCIPIDPFYLTWLARKNGLTTRFIELAGEINSSMPNYVIQRLTEFLNEEGKSVNGSKITILGMAYKQDVDDDRESPSYILLQELLKRKAKVNYNDPYIPQIGPTRHHEIPNLKSIPLTAEYLASQDCVIIATNHSCYDYELIVKHSNLVIDTRNATCNVSDHGSVVRRA
ncbi:MAG: UDP-N-acetyl-D-glucosamine dehydrogenase [Blastopirellula sp.]|nr:MAG: UDP-N-acetyl-D-glucosamine dehydrogenase [Blastopirellula sp.]